MLEAQAGLGMPEINSALSLYLTTKRSSTASSTPAGNLATICWPRPKPRIKGGAMAGAAAFSDGVWMYQLTDKKMSRRNQRDGQTGAP